MDGIDQPKSGRGKRFLKSREPKGIENPKTTFCVKGHSASNTVAEVLKDFAALKKPLAVMFNGKNNFQPMEDSTPLTAFCEKGDASLFVFGSHNKKRPHNLIFGRLHAFQVLDMFELGIENFKSLNEFKTQVSSAFKPMLLFTEGFDGNANHERLKNFFIDFFRGDVVEFISLQGLEHLLVFSIAAEKLRFRSYKTSLKKSVDRIPKVELEEVGPHIDFSLRRFNIAPEKVFKQACRIAPQLKIKKVKNIKDDTLGTTRGRIHMQRQDYTQLETGRIRSLKKRKLTDKEKKKLATVTDESLAKKQKAT